jgi:hypothetical protein
MRIFCAAMVGFACPVCLVTRGTATGLRDLRGSAGRRAYRFFFPQVRTFRNWGLASAVRRDLTCRRSCVR